MNKKEFAAKFKGSKESKARRVALKHRADVRSKDNAKLERQEERQQS